MIARDLRDIAHRVQDALRKGHESGKRARVQPDAIVPELGGKWYYVPVEITPNDRELGMFYELFSLVEEALESEGLDVLLVPIRREAPVGGSTADSPT